MAAPSAADAELYELAERAGQALRAVGWRIATAESCTAGWIAKALTDVPGSSQWFECGYVTYSDAAKMRDVGVSAQTLAAHGAVSEATVREMAQGALRVSGAELAVAVSGIVRARPPRRSMLREPVTQLATWAKAHLAELDTARAEFDRREALAQRPHGDGRPEGEAGEPQRRPWPARAAVVDHGERILGLAATRVMGSRACANTAEVEPHHRCAALLERARQRVDDLVLERPTVERVRTAHHPERSGRVARLDALPARPVALDGGC